DKKPSDSDLKSLFDANKGRTPEPWSPYPAFKQPRLVWVEWLELPIDRGFSDPTYERWGALRGLTLLSDPMMVLGSFVNADYFDKGTIQRIRGGYRTPRVLEGDPGMAYIHSKPPKERIQVEGQLFRDDVNAFGLPVVSHAAETAHVD